MPVTCRSKKDVAPGKNNKICFDSNGKVLNGKKKNNSESIVPMPPKKKYTFKKSDPVILTEYDEQLFKKFNLILYPFQQKKYESISVAGLNKALIELGLRKSTTVSGNSGGNRATKLAKVLKAKGGEAILNEMLNPTKVVKLKQSKDYSTVFGTKFKPKIKIDKSLITTKDKNYGVPKPEKLKKLQVEIKKLKSLTVAKPGKLKNLQDEVKKLKSMM
tara:strand:- start:23 stop:673 length:651 start_codon:yes stop_codon:yes gene_type:complete